MLQMQILVLNIKRLVWLIILKILAEMHLVMKIKKVLVIIIILIKRVLMKKLPISLLLQVERAKIILV